MNRIWAPIYVVMRLSATCLPLAGCFFTARGEYPSVEQPRAYQPHYVAIPVEPPYSAVASTAISVSEFSAPGVVISDEFMSLRYTS